MAAACAGVAAAANTPAHDATPATARCPPPSPSPREKLTGNSPRGENPRARRAGVRLDVELAHHVGILMRAIVAVEYEATGEVPELMADGDGLVRADPDRVLEPGELAGIRSAPFDSHDPEAPEVDVNRVAPSAGFVDEDPVLVGVDQRLGIVACGVELEVVDRPVASVPVEAERADRRGWLRVGRVGPRLRGPDVSLAAVGLDTVDAELHDREELVVVRVGEQVDEDDPRPDRILREIDDEFVPLGDIGMEERGDLRHAREEEALVRPDVAEDLVGRFPEVGTYAKREQILA